LRPNKKKYWAENQTFATAKQRKTKHYVRYVSLSIRAGLHVGHPLGYIASDVYARYKDIKVLMYCTDGL
jgi:leucyl-tRNA synthetase